MTDLQSENAASSTNQVWVEDLNQRLMSRRVDAGVINQIVATLDCGPWVCGQCHKLRLSREEACELKEKGKLVAKLKGQCPYCKIIGYVQYVGKQAR